MKNCVFVIEIGGERERALLKQFKACGFVVTALGQETFFKELKKIYIFPISCILNFEKAKTLEDGSVVFSRNISGETTHLLNKKNIDYYDYMDDELFVCKNAYLTAEGSLFYILQYAKSALFDLQILILGGGRISKCLLNILKNNKCVVDVCARSLKEVAYAACFADDTFTLDKLKEHLHRYDIVINTIPEILLKGDLLRLLKGGCFVLDLASKPGGVDFAAAKELEIECLHALGVPSKIMPQTAAKNLKDSILKRLI